MCNFPPETISGPRWRWGRQVVLADGHLGEGVTRSIEPGAGKKTQSARGRDTERRHAAALGKERKKEKVNIFYKIRSVKF